MSKLPNAPLIEVIFEIRWSVTAKEELEEVHYLHGDLYPILKAEYPVRETVNAFPIEFFINAPTHRFRAAVNDYPLVQVGPGIVTVNTTDSKYFWDEYEARILKVVEKLNSVYTFKENHNVRLVLQYIDMLPYDFEKGDVIKYLEDSLNISVKQNFYNKDAITKNLTLGLSFEIDLGAFNLNITRGRNNKGQEGLALQTNLTSKVIKPETAIIKNWLERAHEVCSESFKNMTKGKLYESFAKK